jgi:quercetin dioxygenase-like cupin family protein
MMASVLSRPFRPIELDAAALAHFSLPFLAEDLKREPEYARSGISALTLARDDHVTLVLVALRQAALMREHRAPSAATLVLLSGRADFLAGDGSRTALEAGSLMAFSADVPHAVEAVEDAVCLLVIGGRQRPKRRGGTHEREPDRTR